jgi:hypothetical protein
MPAGASNLIVTVPVDGSNERLDFTLGASACGWERESVHRSGLGQNAFMVALSRAFSVLN